MPYDYRVVHCWGLEAWLRRTAFVTALVAGACADEGPPPAPAQLAILVQPGNSTADGAITPAPQVAIQDAQGRSVRSATAAVTVAFASNPAGATLSGTRTVTATNGVATFTDLHITKAGTGYTLTASSSGLTSATSGTFDIAAGAPTQLAFTGQPSSATAGAAITPAVQVAVQDAWGNLVTTATNAVTVALAVNPGNGTLSGTTTVAAVNGIATFADLKINNPGTGYALAASATAFTSATSAAFGVGPPLVFTTVTTGGAGQGSHSCGVATDGAVYCWGFNGNGQLGDGTRVSHVIPLAVQAPAGVTFQSVSGGGQHSCAVTAGSVAYCWGRNEFGRLGDGTGADRTAPSLVAAPSGVTFSAVSSGNDGHSCGLATGGAIYCWGWNGNGQLGDNSTGDQLAPVLAQAPAGVTFTAVTTGQLHSCALATNGDVYCWGTNGNGQLGDSSTVERHTPVRARAPGGVTFVQVDAGYTHTCAVTASGAAYCWGANSAGQLGDNTTADRLAPTPVQGSLQFASVMGGGGHTCGVTTAGVGYCWGANRWGQLGDNTTADKLTPTAVAGGLTLSVASAGLAHTCAVATAPTAGVYCWGNNGHGQLGDGTTTQRLVPTRAIH